MRYQTTTWQRSIAAARKLQPDVLKLETYPIYIVDSTSELGMDYQVELGDNKFNLLLGAKCDCKGPNNLPCVNIAAAFLQYTSTLEDRLWKGCDYITQAQDTGSETPEYIEEITNLWTDLLDRYERCCDLLKAIELGWDISNLRTAFKDRLPSTPDKSYQLLSA